MEGGDGWQTRRSLHRHQQHSFKPESESISGDPDALSIVSEAPSAVKKPQTHRHWPEVCSGCEQHDLPEACCTNAMQKTPTSHRDQPEWFDTVTFVGGFAIIFIMMFVCLLHQFRKQTLETRRRRSRFGHQNSSVEDTATFHEPMIICVDLNKKLAFPLATPNSTAPDNAANSTGHQTVAQEHPPAGLPPTGVHRLLMHAQSSSTRVMNDAAYVLFELPIQAARSTGRTVSGLISSAGRSGIQPPGSVGLNVQPRSRSVSFDRNSLVSSNPAHSRHLGIVDTISEQAVTESGAVSGCASGMEGSVDVESSSQWFQTLPPTNLPCLAIMPNAEVFLCRPVSQKRTGNEVEPSASAAPMRMSSLATQDWALGVLAEVQQGTPALEATMRFRPPATASSTFNALGIARTPSEERCAQMSDDDVRALIQRVMGRQARIRAGIPDPACPNEAVSAPGEDRAQDDQITHIAESSDHDTSSSSQQAGDDTVPEMNAYGKESAALGDLGTNSSWQTVGSSFFQDSFITPLDTPDTAPEDLRTSSDSVQHAPMHAVDSTKDAASSGTGSIVAYWRSSIAAVRLPKKGHGHVSMASLESEGDIEMPTRESRSNSETESSEAGRERMERAGLISLDARSYHYASVSGCGAPSMPSTCSAPDSGTGSCRCGILPVNEGSTANACAWGSPLVQHTVIDIPSVDSAGCFSKGRPSSSGGHGIDGVSTGDCREERVMHGDRGCRAISTSASTSCKVGDACGGGVVGGECRVTTMCGEGSHACSVKERAGSMQCQMQRSCLVGVSLESWGRITHDSHASDSASSSCALGDCMHDQPESVVASAPPQSNSASFSFARAGNTSTRADQCSMRAPDHDQTAVRAWAMQLDSDSDTESESDWEGEDSTEPGPLFTYFYMVKLSDTDFGHVLPGSACMGALEEAGESGRMSSAVSVREISPKSSMCLEQDFAKSTQ